MLKVKYALKGTKFQIVESVIEKAASVLKKFTEEDFQHCFHTNEKSQGTL